MPRIAYVNGRYVPHGEAAVHIEDRGYQFADGVYEVTCVHRGEFVDGDGHMTRLTRSLKELQIAWPISPRALSIVMRELVRRNRVYEGIIYLQITRGVASRDHAFPARSESSLVLTTKHVAPFDIKSARKGIHVISIPDIRWKRCDIKSVSLLPNILGKQEAKAAGAYEAWMVDDAGRVTEGTSTNAWIVTAKNELVTHQVDRAILNGITRIAVLRLAAEEGVKFVERTFTVAEARRAREAFLTSTTSFVKPVVRLDGKPIADGCAGPLTRKLMDYYADYIERPADKGAA
jgi:D-alanine transaminase